jgi:hypothetical protein
MQHVHTYHLVALLLSRVQRTTGLRHPVAEAACRCTLVYLQRLRCMGTHPTAGSHFQQACQTSTTQEWPTGTPPTLTLQVAAQKAATAVVGHVSF